jgi:hypothetical protein
VQAGAVEMQVAVPASVSFVGLPLRQQVVSLLLDANLNITQITATNALVGTVGAF